MLCASVMMNVGGFGPMHCPWSIQMLSYSTDGEALSHNDGKKFGRTVGSEGVGCQLADIEELSLLF
jgi:hypothetical protein